MATCTVVFGQCLVHCVSTGSVSEKELQVEPMVLNLTSSESFVKVDKLVLFIPNTLDTNGGACLCAYKIYLYF